MINVRNVLLDFSFKLTVHVFPAQLLMLTVRVVTIMVSVLNVLRDFSLNPTLVRHVQSTVKLVKINLHALLVLMDTFGIQFNAVVVQLL